MNSAPTPRPVLSTHHGGAPPALRDAAADALADAFAADPWARYVTGRAFHPHDAALMRVPACAGARRGGLVTAAGGRGVVGASTWVPAGRREAGMSDVVRARALGLPFVLGPAAMSRLVREATDTGGWADGVLRPDDAYLWVLGVRREAHGRGIGRMLVEATAADAASAGHTRLSLVTYNADNVSRYEAMGFSLLEVSRRGTGLTAHALARPSRGEGRPAGALATDHGTGTPSALEDSSTGDVRGAS